MAKMRLWYDREGDYLEFGIARKKGYFKDMGNDVWERVDGKGHVIGVAILNFTKRTTGKREELELPVEIAFREHS